MDIKEEQRFDVITRNTDEILTEEDLKVFLENGVPLKHYIGFEISGKVHLGTGLVCMQKVKDFMDAGVDCSIFLADWHSWINEKLGGDFDVIREIAVNYFKEGIKAAFLCVGGDPAKLKFVLGSDLYHNNDGYWETVVELSKHTTLARMMRTVDILGREAGESLYFAKLIYPAMQVADIFAQSITLAHAGTDQRKAHVIMRDVADKLTLHRMRGAGGKAIKPIAVHHHLLLGLQKPPVWPIHEGELRAVWAKAKMSKSIPDSAVFIHDTPEEIREKIEAAFCPPPRGRSPLGRGEGPPQEIHFNPILDWAKHILFVSEDFTLKADRPARFGGPIAYQKYGDLARDYVQSRLHPEDLKNAVAEALIEKLAPVREYFTNPKRRAMLKELEKKLEQHQRN